MCIHSYIKHTICPPHTIVHVCIPQYTSSFVSLDINIEYLMECAREGFMQASQRKSTSKTPRDKKVRAGVELDLGDSVGSQLD